MPERGIEPDIIGDDTVLDGYDRIRRGSRAGREIRKKACVGGCVGRSDTRHIVVYSSSKVYSSLMPPTSSSLVSPPIVRGGLAPHNLYLWSLLLLPFLWGR
ncbi:hypothetical protein GW17_00040364 [Ensete ventricosum]|nr:hypothetical protein GW17_00040364 [Ensete ventricosum]